MSDDKKVEMSDGSMRSLDLEERVLYQARISRLKTILQAIGGLASRILQNPRARNFPETIKDDLREIKKLSKTNPED